MSKFAFSIQIWKTALIGLNDSSIFYTSRYRTFFWRSSFIWTWVFSNYFWRLDVFVCRSIGSRLPGSSYCNIFCRQGMFLELKRIKIWIVFLDQNIVWPINKYSDTSKCFFQILIWARSIGGRRNLARKTLIDKRFLI